MRGDKSTESCSPAKKPRITDTSSLHNNVLISNNQCNDTPTSNETQQSTSGSATDPWAIPSCSGVNLHEAVNQWEDDVARLKTLFPTLEEEVLASYLEVYDFDECIQFVSNYLQGHEDGLDDCSILNESNRYQDLDDATHPENSNLFMSTVNETSMSTSSGCSKKGKDPKSSTMSTSIRSSAALNSIGNMSLSTSNKPQTSTLPLNTANVTIKETARSGKDKNKPSYEDILARISAVKYGTPINANGPKSKAVSSTKSKKNSEAQSSSNSNNSLSNDLQQADTNNSVNELETNTATASDSGFSNSPQPCDGVSQPTLSSETTNNQIPISLGIMTSANAVRGAAPITKDSFAAAFQQATSHSTEQSMSLSASALPVPISWGNVKLTHPKENKHEQHGQSQKENTLILPVNNTTHLSDKDEPKHVVKKNQGLESAGNLSAHTPSIQVKKESTTSSFGSPNKVPPTNPFRLGAAQVKKGSTPSSFGSPNHVPPTNPFRLGAAPLKKESTPSSFGSPNHVPPTNPFRLGAAPLKRESTPSSFGSPDKVPPTNPLRLGAAPLKKESSSSSFGSPNKDPPTNPFRLGAAPLKRESTPSSFGSPNKVPPTNPFRLGAAPLKKESTPSSFGSPNHVPPTNPFGLDAAPLKKESTPSSFGSPNHVPPTNPFGLDAAPLKRESTPSSFGSPDKVPPTNPLRLGAAPLKKESSSSSFGSPNKMPPTTAQVKKEFTPSSFGSPNKDPPTNPFRLGAAPLKRESTPSSFGSPNKVPPTNPFRLGAAPLKKESTPSSFGSPNHVPPTNPFGLDAAPLKRESTPSSFGSPNKVPPTNPLRLGAAPLKKESSSSSFGSPNKMPPTTAQVKKEFTPSSFGSPNKDPPTNPFRLGAAPLKRESTPSSFGSPNKVPPTNPFRLGAAPLKKESTPSSFGSPNHVPPTNPFGLDAAPLKRESTPSSFGSPNHVPPTNPFGLDAAPLKRESTPSSFGSPNKVPPTNPFRLGAAPLKKESTPSSFGSPNNVPPTNPFGLDVAPLKRESTPSSFGSPNNVPPTNPFGLDVAPLKRESTPSSFGSPNKVPPTNSFSLLQLIGRKRLNDVLRSKRLQYYTGNINNNNTPCNNSTTTTTTVVMATPIANITTTLSSVTTTNNSSLTCQTSDQSACQSNNQPSWQSFHQPSSQLSCPTICQSSTLSSQTTCQFSSPSSHQSTRQSTSPSTHQSTCQSTSPSSNQSTHQLNSPTSNQSTGLSTRQSTGQSICQKPIHVGIDIRHGNNRIHSSMKRCYDRSAARRDIAKPYVRVTSTTQSNTSNSPTVITQNSTISTNITSTSNVLSHSPITTPSSGQSTVTFQTPTRQSTTKGNSAVNRGKGKGPMRNPSTFTPSTPSQGQSNSGGNYQTSTNVFTSSSSSLSLPSATNNVNMADVQAVATGGSNNDSSAFLDNFNQGIEHMNNELENMLKSVMNKNNRLTDLCAGQSGISKPPQNDEKAEKEMLSLQNETEILAKLFPELDPNYIFHKLEKHKGDSSRVTKVNEELLKKRESRGNDGGRQNKKVSWLWVDDSRKLNPFTDAESNYIEAHFRKGRKKTDIQFVGSNRPLGFYFRAMAMTDYKTGRTVNIQRIDGNAGSPHKSLGNNGPAQNPRCLVEVFPGTSEFTRVESALKRSITHANVTKIEKIDNSWLQKKYYMQYDLLKQKNGEAKVNVKELFHGTRGTLPSMIWDSEDGFDMRYSAAGMWGRGCYFAVNASYSHDYAYATRQHRTKYHQMFLAHVLTGDSADLEPNRSIIKPPCNNQTGRDYDSITGITKGHRIYVLYNNAMSYPAYLITYTT